LYNWHSGCQNDCICLFIFKSAGEGEGCFKGDSTWLIYCKKKHQQNTDSHQAALFNSFKLCAPVVFVWFWLFLCCLGRRGRRHKRGSYITIVFPSIAFNFFNCHQMNFLYSLIKSKILVYMFNFSFLKQTLEIQ
jgi:hypothetical protein